MNTDPIRILLVEDNSGDAFLIREGLKESGSAQFDMTHVHRLGEGLERLKESTYDVVLLDLGLPDSNGLETLVVMCGHAPEVPIVVLTHLEDETLAMEGVHGGAQDFLSKGHVDNETLVRCLRYAIERKEAQEALQKSEEQAKRLAEQNEVLAEIGRIISSTLDIEAVYEPFAEQVRSVYRQHIWDS